MTDVSVMIRYMEWCWNFNTLASGCFQKKPS